LPNCDNSAARGAAKATGPLISTRSNAESP
jgi:hypothetical protein